MGEVVMLRPKSASPEQETAVSIAEWMRHAMTQNSISAAAWAAKAGISDTSISRFLKHGAPVPKAVTLAKLASAIGLPPPAFHSESQTLVDIPVILASLYHHQGLRAARMSAAETTKVLARFREAVGMRVTADTASGVGIRLGDMVIVDTSRPPAPGNMVAVTQDDGSMAVLEWQPPFLLPRGSPMATLRADDPSIKVVGVCVQLQRDLPL